MRFIEKIIRIIVVGVAVYAMPGTIFAQAETVKAPMPERIVGGASMVSSDSLAKALATFWGGSAKLPDFTPDELGRYLDGVRSVLSDSSFQTHAYEQGMSFGAILSAGLTQMSELGMTIDRKAFVAAVTDVMQGKNVGFTMEGAGEYIDRQIAPIIGSQAPKVTAESQREFLDEAAKEDGAITTPSGLVFKVVTEGEGDFPTEDDRVNLDYTGRLSDGSGFDKTDEPVNFDIVRLVPGFAEGIKMMRPGGTYRVVIPPELGYGERGVGDVIPPGAALDFTVTLLSVDRGAAKK